MINQVLHRQPTPLDRDQHRGLRVTALTDWGVAKRLNSIFIAAVEFSDVCREYPIVFVRAGTQADGVADVAPVAVFGLSNEENLFLQGRDWRARYMPALLRLYPFAMAKVSEEQFAVCVDSAWEGLSQTEGQLLFEADGQPSEFAKQVLSQLETLQGEVQRTRAVGLRLQELGILQDMRFDVTMPDGQKVAVEGFLTVDETKLKALPDSTLVELQRNGILGLVYAHLISLGNMRRLAEWKGERAVVAANG